MKSIQATLFILCVASFSSVVAGPIFPHCVQSKRVCCLKGYDYRPTQLSNPETAVTYAETNYAILRTTAPDAIKKFPLAASSLINDHCALSDLSVVIEKDGTWSINFQAEQNPALVPPAMQPKFVRFTKNRFYVTVRAYTDYPLRVDVDTSALGQPQLETLIVQPFWMDRGTKRNLQFRGCSRSIEHNFERITRMEIDLQYE